MKCTVVRERIGVEASVVVEGAVGTRASVVGAAASAIRESTTGASTNGGAAWAVARTVRSGNGLHSMVNILAVGGYSKDLRSRMRWCKRKRHN